jgi:hypothetical protein
MSNMLPAAIPETSDDGDEMKSIQPSKLLFQVSPRNSSHLALASAARLASYIMQDIVRVAGRRQDRRVSNNVRSIHHREVVQEDLDGFGQNVQRGPIQ